MRRESRTDRTQGCIALQTTTEFSGRVRVLSVAFFLVWVAVLMLASNAQAAFMPPNVGDMYTDRLTYTTESGAVYAASSFAFDADGALWITHNSVPAGSAGVAVYRDGSTSPTEFYDLGTRYIESCDFDESGRWLYLTNAYDAEIVKFDSTREVMDTESFFFSDGDSSPADIEVVDSNTIFISDSVRMKVFAVNLADPDASLPLNIPAVPEEELTGVRGIAAGDDYLLVAYSFYGDKIARFDLNGNFESTTLVPAWELGGVSDLFVDKFETTYVLGEADSNARFGRIAAVTGANLGVYPNPSEGTLSGSSKLIIDDEGSAWVNSTADLSRGVVQRYAFTPGDPDIDAPSTTDNAPTDWAKGPLAVTLTATDGEGTGVAHTYYSIDGSYPSIETAGDVVISTEGTQTLKYFSVDSASNTETVKAKQVRVDANAPVSSAVVAPIYYGDVHIDLSAMDALSGVKEIRWRLNGGDWFVGNSVDLTAADRGDYVLEYYAVDNAGNSELPTHERFFSAYTHYEQNAEQVMYRSTWSTVSAGAWSGGSYARSNNSTAGAFVTFTGNVIEVYGPMGPDLGKMRLRMDGGTAVDVDLYSETPARARLGRFTGVSGAHVLAVEALGTKNDASSGTGIGVDYIDVGGVLTIDTTPPTTTDDAHAGWYNALSALTLTAIDNGYVAQTLYRVAGGPVQVYSGPTTLSANGNVSVEFRSIDGRGNSETTKTANVQVDSQTPVSTSDAQSSYVDSGTVNFSATDNLSGVAVCQYNLDGAEWITGNSVYVTGYGDHVLQYRAVDVAGNIESAKTANITVRRASITYTYLSRSPELNWYGSWGDWNGNARRTGSSSTGNYVSGYGRATRIEAWAYKQDGAGTARINLDGVVSWVDLDSASSTPQLVKVFDSGVLADQNHFFMYGASNRDYYWESGRVNLHSVVVEGLFGSEIPDNGAPTTTSNIPSGWTKPPFSVSLTESDVLGNPGPTFYDVSTTPTDAPDATTQYETPFAVSQEGTSYVSFYSIDLFGNQESIQTKALRLDSSPPTTTSDIVADYTNQASISLTATDAYSGVGTTHYRVDRGAWTTGTAVTVPGSTPGTHTLEWYSTDVLGNTETTQAATFTVLRRWEQEQTTAALIEVEGRDSWRSEDHPSHSTRLILCADATGTVAGTFTGDRFDLISATGPDYGIARIVLDDEFTAMCDQYSENPAYQQRVFSRAGLGAGNHTFRIEWTGQANQSSSRTDINIDAFELVGALVADEVPPVSTLTYEGDAWRDSPEVITISATDNGVVEPVIRYRLDSSGEYVYTGPFEVSAEGTTTVEYWATDGVGNEEDRRESLVRIDRTAPSVVTSAPAEWVRGPVTATLAASDAGCGVASVVYSTDGSTPETPYPAGGIVISAEGTTTVRYKATDALGNATAVRSFEVRIDDSAPAVSDDAPTEWVTGAQSVTLTAADALSGLAGIDYSLDAASWGAYDGLISIAGEGTHTLSYRAHDAAGNQGAPSTATVRIDDTAPVTTSNALASYAETATVSLTATDALSGVASTESRLDGGAWTSGTSVTVTQGGRHTVEFRSTDNVGHTEEVRTATFDVVKRFDQSDAAFSFRGVWTLYSNASHYQGAYRYANTSGATAYVGFTGTGFSLITQKAPDFGIAQVSVDGGAPVDVDLYAGGYFFKQSVFTRGGLADGRHLVKISWTGRRNVASTNTKIGIDALDVVGSMTPDTEAPLTTAVADGAWSASPVAVSLSATDVSTWAANTYYRIGSTTTTYTSPFALSAEGTTTVEYWSVDGAGNTEERRSFDVRVDTTAPSVDTSAPAEWVRGPVTATLAASDAGCGVASVVYSTHGSTPETPYPAGGIVISAEGTTTVRYKATDALGNATAVRSFEVRIDDSAPAVSDDAPTEWVTGAQSVTLTAADALSGLAGIDYSLDAASWGAYDGLISIAGEGTHTLSYRAHDAAGNQGAPSTATVRIDDTAPVTTSNALASYAETATVSLTATDALSGVASTESRLDGGAWTSGTSVTVTQGGRHTVEFRSTDNVGHTEEVRTATFDVVKRFDQSDAAFSFRGVWTLYSNASHYQGAYRYANTSGATAYVGFTGTGFSLITQKAPDFGIAQVSVDGGAPVDVDLYAGGYFFKQSVFTRGGLADGRHLVKISWTGRRNVASTNTKIGIDALDVVGSMTPDTEAPLTTAVADGAWSASPVAVSLSATDVSTWAANTYYRIGSTTTTYTSPFALSAEGTTTVEYWSVDGAGNTEERRSFDVRVDTTAPSVDTSAPAEWVRGPVTATLAASDAGCGVASVVYSTHGSTPETPYPAGGIVISAEGTTTVRYKATDALGNATAVRSFEVRIDDSAPAVSDDAPTEWVTGAQSVTLTAADALSGLAGIDYSLDAASWGAYDGLISIAGEGTHTLSYRAHDAAGNQGAPSTATVRIDDTAPVTTSNALASYAETATVSLTATDALSGVASTESRLDGGAWTSGTSVTVTQGGRHTVEFRSTDNVGHTEEVRTATFDVVKRFDQSDAAFSFRGVWTLYSNASHYQGAYRYANTSGATAYVGFTGTGFSLITQKAPDFGIAQVSVDGGAPVDVDLYAGGYFFKQSVFTRGGLADGRHLVKISWTGRRNVASTNTKIGIDALDVVGSMTPDTEAPLTTAVADGAWSASPVAVSLSATDVSTWAANTYYRIGSTTTTYTSPFALSAEGTTTVEYWSVDGAGNTEERRSFDVRVDTTAPSVDTSAPAEWVRGPVTATLAASDAGCGVASVVYSTHGSTPETPYPAGGIVISAEGTTTVRYKATDALGNATAVRSFEVRIDDSAPAVSDDAPTEWVTGAQSVTLTAADALSGLAGIDYSLDAASWGAYDGLISIAGEGTHTLSYRAHDAAGNQGAPSTATVRIDDTAPVTTSNALASYAETATVSLTATDALSGVASTESRLDGGAWTSGTSVTVTQGGRHTVEFRSTDNVGHTEEVRTATFDVVKRFDNTVADFGFVGTWSTLISSSRYGGSYTYTSSAGAIGCVAFSGTGFDLVASRLPHAGIMRVTVDDEAPVLVDLYAPGFLHQSNVLERTGLPNGTHTLRLEFTGTKNTSSAGTQVNFDAIDIIGNPLPAWPAFDTEAPMTSSNLDGAWRSRALTMTLSATDALSGVRQTQYRIAGGNIAQYVGPVGITTDGTTEVEFWSSDHAGNAEVHQIRQVRIDSQPPVVDTDAAASYDGTATVSVTASDAGSGLSSVEYRIDDGPWVQGDTAVIAAGGSHTVAARATDGAGNVSSTVSSEFSVRRRYEQTDTHLGWTGTWTTYNNPSRSGGSYAYTSSAGSIAHVNFVGTSLDLVSSKLPNAGIMRVSVDSSLPVDVDLYSPGYEHQRRVFSVAGLSDGPHTITILASGTKNPASAGTQVNVDAIDAVADLTQWTQRSEQTDPLMVVEGMWVTADSAAHSAGSYVYSYAPGAAVNVAFTGTAVSWVAPKGTIYGIAEVSVDGDAPITVDLYATKYVANQPVWAKSGLSSGPHTLRIVVTGTKNDAASSTNIGFDAVDLAGSLSQATAPLAPGELSEQTSPLLAYEGTWIDASSASHSAGDYRYTYAPGAAVNARFTGTDVTWVAPKGRMYGIAEVSVDSGPATSVDLYSGNFIPQSQVWSARGLEPGTHTIRITYTGRKNPAATTGYLGVDAFRVVGTLESAAPLSPPARSEEDSVAVSLSPGWVQNAYAGHSGGAYRYSASASATAEFGFVGTGVRWIAPVGTNYGIATVSIDDGPPEEVDLFAAKYISQALVWHRTDLAPGPHTLRITVTGTRGGASTANNVGVDAFDVMQ